jgi:biopolymer transport protein ExbD
MSEIQVKDNSDGKKSRQKKQTLRVDFTPMVDMNMLLITFFMFCTTLLKPQVMNISMPSKEKVKVEDATQIRQSTALTLIMGEGNNIYYYKGMPDEQKYLDTAFLQTTSYGENGLRQILLEMNGAEKEDGVYNKLQNLKIQLSKGTVIEELLKVDANAPRKIDSLRRIPIANDQIQQFLYDSIVNKIQSEANKKGYVPNVLIKPVDGSSYKNMVDVLDEMLVCNIGFYQIIDLSEGDRYLVYKKTGNPVYLSDKQKKEINIK